MRYVAPSPSLSRRGAATFAQTRRTHVGVRASKRCGIAMRAQGVGGVGVDGTRLVAAPGVMEGRLTPSRASASALPAACGGRLGRRTGVTRRFIAMRATSDESKGGSTGSGDPEPVPFGYTRKDVLLIGFGTTAAGVVMYNSLQQFGMSQANAGNIVQLTFVLGLTLVWVGSYLFRVKNKEMTYVKQLKTYEQQVMEKRLEEIRTHVPSLT